MHSSHIFHSLPCGGQALADALTESGCSERIPEPLIFDLLLSLSDQQPTAILAVIHANEHCSKELNANRGQYHNPSPRIQNHMTHIN
mmetsp:Transcript_8004/g.29782  ORF Transcript_8004/g.29782 Transcript_8004/m.29782 type:complete len:87 (+) Transcript_8004:188-448(+)